MSRMKTAKLVDVRPEAQVGSVELGSHRLIPFHVNVVARKSTTGQWTKFSTARQIRDYVVKHHIRDVEVELDESSNRILAVLLP